MHQKELVVNLIQSNTSKLEEARLQVTVAEKQLNSAIELKTAIASHLKHLKQVSRKIENFENSGHLKIPFAEKKPKGVYLSPERNDTDFLKKRINIEKGKRHTTQDYQQFF